MLLHKLVNRHESTAHTHGQFSVVYRSCDHLGAKQVLGGVDTNDRNKKVVLGAVVFKESVHCIWVVLRGCLIFKSFIETWIVIQRRTLASGVWLTILGITKDTWASLKRSFSFWSDNHFICFHGRDETSFSTDLHTSGLWHPSFGLLPFY